MTVAELIASLKAEDTDANIRVVLYDHILGELDIASVYLTTSDDGGTIIAIEGHIDEPV